VSEWNNANFMYSLIIDNNTFLFHKTILYILFFDKYKTILYMISLSLRKYIERDNLSGPFFLRNCILSDKICLDLIFKEMFKERKSLVEIPP
jgi:hypothetical protein